jgi:hypothetical protein
MKKLTLSQQELIQGGERKTTKTNGFLFGVCIRFSIGLSFVTLGHSAIATWALRGTSTGSTLVCAAI